MNTESRQAKIDAYLLGTGSAEQRVAFEAELEQDTELRAQLADTELAMAAIEVHEDAMLKARLRELEAGLSPVTVAEAPAPAPKLGKTVPMQPRARSSSMWWAIAASLLLLIAAGWFILRPPSISSGPELAMANFEPYANVAHPFERGASDDSIEAVAFRAYEADDFATAEANLNKIPQTDIRSFYIGQTQLAQKKFTEAEKTFARLAGKDNEFQPESPYYQALALVGLERFEEAKAILQSVSQDAESPMQDRATALLKML